jgi:hypothetical protein
MELFGLVSFSLKPKTKPTNMAYKYQIDDRFQAKGGLISLSVFTLIFIGVFIYFYINYDDYSETMFSIKRQRNVQVGLGPSVVGWGTFGIPFAFFGIFLLAMTRDFKQVGVGVADDHVFLNKDGIKATKIVYSNITDLKEDEHFIAFKLKDYSDVIKNTFILFRWAKKNKYIKKGSSISISKSEFQEGEAKEVLNYIASRVIQEAKF